MEDVLTDVLRLIRLKSCVYFMKDFRSPWAMGIGAGSVAQFHVIVRGQCMVQVGEVWHAASTGDVFLFPHGLPHVLADREDRNPTPGQEVIRSFAGPEPLFETGDVATKLLCGHFEYDPGVRHPLLAELPDLIHVTSFDAVAPGSLQSIVPLLIREMGDSQPGSDTVVERLAEILLVQVLRAHLSQQPDLKGFWAALSDARLTRAIKVIHSRAGEKLTLEDLADAAAMSRSAFSLLFKSVTSLSPIGYLAKWRMQQARGLLKSGQLLLAEVAEHVGYESEVAFSRAFRREYGESPSAVRRAARQQNAPQS